MRQSIETLSEALIDRRVGLPAEHPEFDVLATNVDFSLNRLYLYSDAPRPRLRVGVMIDGSSATLFRRRVIQDVHDCNFADIVCVIENGDPWPKRALPVDRTLLRRAAARLLNEERRRHLLYFAYMRIIDSKYRVRPNPLARVDCSDLLTRAERIVTTPIRTKFVDRFATDAIRRIKALDLDVVLRFGYRIIRGDILSIARYGVWSFHHDDSEYVRGSPACLWPLIEGSPLSGAVLQRLDESLDAGAVLCKASVATSPSPSVSANRYGVYWNAQHFAIRKLYELHRFGPGHLETHIIRTQRYRGKRALYRTPTNAEMARWLGRRFLRAGLRKLSARSESIHWCIGVRRASPPLSENSRAVTPEQFTWLQSPQGRFWADPFLIEDGSDTWLFFASCSYAEKRAVISCGKIEDGELKDVRAALERPYHLSYPHVFSYSGTYWMIPESHQAREIQLYRAKRFPDEWVFERTLLNLRAVHATPFEHQNRWWMLASPVVVNGHAPFTLLFAAREPWGPWELHRASPICSDARWSRSAGAIVRRGERLFRPSQDHALGSGRSICFNEVTVLNETDYEEVHGPMLKPTNLQALAGVDMYACAGGWEAIGARALARRVHVLASASTRHSRGALTPGGKR
jgi:hypothetical protein